MKKTVEMIKHFFEKNNWQYDYEKEDRVFVSGLDMGNVLGNVKIFIFLEESFYNVYMVLNSKIESKYYSDVAEFLHRVNYGLQDGNFEMDYRDGEIRYKSHVNFKNIEVSEEIVEESIIVCAVMIDKYGKGLLKLMLNAETPEECVKYCEEIESD